jgi:hypothetical protein
VGAGMKHKIIPVLIVAFLTLFVSIFGDRLQASPIDQKTPLSAESVSVSSTFASTQIPVLEPVASLIRQSSHNILVAGQTIISTTIDEAPPSGKAITKFLFDFSQQPYWLRLGNTQSQSLTLNRITSETKAAEAVHYKLARHSKQSEFVLPLTCSRNLLEVLPPGFFLLI